MELDQQEVYFERVEFDQQEVYYVRVEFDQQEVYLEGWSLISRKSIWKGGV